MKRGHVRISACTSLIETISCNILNVAVLLIKLFVFTIKIIRVKLIIHNLLSDHSIPYVDMQEEYKISLLSHLP